MTLEELQRKTQRHVDTVLLTIAEWKPAPGQAPTASHFLDEVVSTGEGCNYLLAVDAT